MTWEMATGIGIACLFLGVFIGFALFAIVSISKRADERAPQPEEPRHIDYYARKVVIKVDDLIEAIYGVYKATLSHPERFSDPKKTRQRCESLVARISGK